MRKLSLTFITRLLLITGFSHSQDVMNPYINEPSITAAQLTIYPPSWDDNGIPLPHSWYNRGNFTGYVGEYEIIMVRHPLFDTQNSGSGTGLQLSYGMETVSFPFMPECTFDINGCSSLINSSTR